MNYTFTYLRASDFQQRNQEFCETDRMGISADNAKKVGVICIRAIQIYEDTQNNYRKEKASLKSWVRDQRSSVRSHGRIFSYKGVSKTRSDLNALISNSNDSALNQIDSMLRISGSNLGLAKSRLAQCLHYAELSEIMLYESIYLESKAQEKAYKNLKASKTTLYFSLWASPIVAWLVISSIFTNILLIIVFAVVSTGAWIYFALNRINKLQQKINRFETAERSVKILQQNKGLQRQENRSLTSSSNNNQSQDGDSDLLEKEKSELELNRELAKHLKEEYVTFENACLSLEIDASNWMDLARKVNSTDQGNSANREETLESYKSPNLLEAPVNFKEDNRHKDEASVLYTADKLRSEFSSFKEAKDFFGVSAKSWGSLADKLNHKRGN